MGNVETHHIERKDGSRTFEREQRDAGVTHEIRHVDPGYVGALAGDALLRVQDLVEDGKALVWKAYLVRVRIDEAGPVARIVRGQDAPFVI